MKNNLISYILYLTSYILYLTSLSFAQFVDLGIGARGSGMSNAFTALSDDVYAIYYNPAGLSNINWKEMGLDYEKLYLGLDDGSSLGNGFIAYVHSFNRLGTFGIGWLNFTLSGYYTENTFIFAYGKQIRYSTEDLPDTLKTPTFLKRLRLPDTIKIPEFIKSAIEHLGKGPLKTGLKLKLLSKSYGKTRYTEDALNLDTGQLRGGQDPVFARGYSRLGLSLDLGVLYDIGRHTLGLTLNDINQPNMGLNSDDKINLGTKLGYAYKGYDFNMTTDIALKQADIIFSAGAEKWFLGKTFAIRGGLGIGTGEYANLSLGGSYRYNGLLQFDYSFRYPLRGISDFFGSHQVSLTLRFGAPVTKELDLESEVQRLKLELENAKKEAEEFKRQAAEKIEKKEAEQLIREAQEKQRQAEERLRQVEKELARVKKELSELMSAEERKKILEGYWSSGMHYYNKGEYEKAISEFQKILELEPGHKEAQIRIKMSKEKLEQKIKEQVEKHYTQGLKAYHAGDLKTAIAELESALKLDPKNEEIQILLERAKKEIQLKER